MVDVEPRYASPTLFVPPLMLTPRLYRTDATKSFLEPMDVVRPYDVEVVCNPDAEHTWTAKIETMNPAAIRALIDYAYIEIHVRDATGEEFVVPMGHYLCDQPSRHYDGLALTGTVEAYGSTLALEQSTLGAAWTLEVGADPAVEMRDIVIGAGILPSMVHIPPSGILATEAEVFHAGEPRKEIVAALADKIGYYQIHPDGTGVMHSHPYHDWETELIAATIGTEPGTVEILEPISETRDRMRVRNRVTVRKLQEPTETEPDKQPIIAVAEITDYSHPLHPVRLQEARHAPLPVILGERIDDSQIETYEVALAKAKNTLAQRASQYETTKVSHVIDRAPGPHQVVWLDVRHGINPIYEGRWRRQSWTYRQQGPVGMIEANLARTVAIG